MPNDVDVASLDFTDDPRVFSDPDGNILVPSLRDISLHRILFRAPFGRWYMSGTNSTAGDVTVVDSGETVLQAFDTMEEALFHLFGEPVDLPDPDDIDRWYDLTVEPGGDDEPIVVTFELDDDPYSGGWKAHISQPAPDRYPAYFCGATPLEALTRMFGLRPADDDGNYEYTPGG